MVQRIMFAVILRPAIRTGTHRLKRITLALISQVSYIRHRSTPWHLIGYLNSIRIQVSHYSIIILTCGDMEDARHAFGRMVVHIRLSGDWEYRTAGIVIDEYNSRARLPGNYRRERILSYSGGHCVFWCDTLSLSHPCEWLARIISTLQNEVGHKGSKHDTTKHD